MPIEDVPIDSVYTSAKDELGVPFVVLSKDEVIEGIPCKGISSGEYYENTVNFHKINGKLSKCFLSKDFEFHGILFKQNTEFSLFSEGKVLGGTLAIDTMIGGALIPKSSILVFTGQYKVNCFESLKSIHLSSDSKIGEYTFEANTTVFTHVVGSAESSSLKLIAVSGSVRQEGFPLPRRDGSDVTFTFNGEGTTIIAVDIKYPMIISGIPCKEGIVYLHPVDPKGCQEGQQYGKVCSCILSQDYYVETKPLVVHKAMPPGDNVIPLTDLEQSQLLCKKGSKNNFDTEGVLIFQPNRRENYQLRCIHVETSKKCDSCKHRIGKLADSTSCFRNLDDAINLGRLDFFEEIEK